MNAKKIMNKINNFLFLTNNPDKSDPSPARLSIFPIIAPKKYAPIN